MKLSELPNIGKELEQKLKYSWHQTPDEFAGKGAIVGTRWRYLPGEIKKTI